ncbi:MAG: hypothetical protein U0903_07940 [Planctomycetales bacterium]
MKPRFSTEFLGGQSTSETKRHFRMDGPVCAVQTPFLNATDSLPAVVPPATTDTEESAIYVPDSYEPKYAYPLLVWLQNGPRTAQSFARTMGHISDRNYVGLGLDLTSHLGKVEDKDEFAAQLSSEQYGLEQWVRNEITRFRRTHHVHSERIYLVGQGWGAMAALQAGFARPDWFAGVIACDVGFPQIPHLVRRFRDLKGKRVMLASTNPTERLEQRRLQRMLHTVGMRLCARNYPAPQKGDLPQKLLRDIDRWVMMDICSPQCV